MIIDSLSVGGARLSGSGTFDTGERVQILFEVDGAPIDVSAEVVRVEHQDILIDRIAVRFDELTTEEHNAIERLVELVCAR